jgi:hypothetical protein
LVATNPLVYRMTSPIVLEGMGNDFRYKRYRIFMYSDTPIVFIVKYAASITLIGVSLKTRYLFGNENRYPCPRELTIGERSS